MRNLTHRARRKEWCDATGKFKYLTREDAAHGMFLLAANTNQEGKTLSAYRCSDCKNFHVGHTPREIASRYGL